MTLTLRGLPIPEGRARGLHRIYPIPYLPVRDTADAWNPQAINLSPSALAQRPPYVSKRKRQIKQQVEYYKNPAFCCCHDSVT